MKQRKDGRWVKTITTAGGKREFFYSTKKTEKQALKDIEKQILNYQEREEKGKLFKEVAEEWYDTHIPTVEVQTASGYKAPYHYCVEALGHFYIKDIKTQDIQKFIDRKASKGFAKKTIKNQLSVVSLIFKFACIQDYIDNNPCEYVRTPRNLGKTKRKIPTVAQIEKVKKHCTTQMEMFAYFLLYTGLRKGEALALTYGDIDFKNKCIYVTKSVYHDSNTPNIKQPKTEAGIRTVMLFDNLEKQLKQHFGKCSKDTLLFPGTNGALMRKSTFLRRWGKYQKDNELNITPHQLRHAFASYILFDAGIDVKVAQLLMGHADVSTTRNIYTQITELRQDNTYLQLNEYVKNFDANVA